MSKRRNPNSVAFVHFPRLEADLGLGSRCPNSEADCKSMAPALEGFQPIYGEARPAWDPARPSSDDHIQLPPFIFSASSPDPSRLRIVASDFRSYTFEAIQTTQDLDDLRDRSGVGGSWSEFVDYLVASLSSDNVKLVLLHISSPTGVTNAKLLAHKSKGMPIMTISLNRLLDMSAADAMAGMSLGLFNAFKENKNKVIEEEERCYLLTKRLAVEQEKKESLQQQLDSVKFSSKPKQQKLDVSDRSFPISSAVADSDTVLNPGMQNSSGRMSSDLNTSKIGHRVVPAHRRVKVRGAVLQDSEHADG